MYNFTGTQVSVTKMFTPLIILLDFVLCVIWQDKSIYEQSGLWAACGLHDMPMLVVMAQLCLTFVYERRVHVLNPLPHLEAIDSSVANTRERELKTGWGVESAGMCLWLIVIASVLIHQQLIKLKSIWAKQRFMSQKARKLNLESWYTVGGTTNTRDNSDNDSSSIVVVMLVDLNVMDKRFYVDKYLKF